MIGLMFFPFLLSFSAPAVTPTTGVKVTCHCAEQPGQGVRCDATHKFAAVSAFCLNDDVECLPCQYGDLTVPTLPPGTFLCPVSCPLRIGADHQLHSARCESVSRLIPFTCQSLCYYSNGYYGTTTTTSLPGGP